MIDLLPHIEAWLAAGEEVAVATVIQVVGSAPRPVGARMIVSSTGRMAGSVSGGCVETTVYEEMMDVLEGKPARKLHFGITEDMIWDVGLACGGTIDVLVQKLDPALFYALAELASREEPVALVTLVSGSLGSEDWEIGDSTLIGPDGIVSRPVASCKTEYDSEITARAQQMLAARAETGTLHEVAPGVEVFIEPYLPPPVLLIVGGVHIAIPLTHFAKELGFRVIVVDPREKFANRERFPGADEVLLQWPDEAFEHLTVNDGTYVVLLTHDPKIDEPTLAAALETNAAYIGAIGSRATHAARFERMARWGVTHEQLQRVYAPVGLDLGGHTPAETALSIMAEVVSVKNGRQQSSRRVRSLRDTGKGIEK
jgi:xanthine dehydrogenase accessory factor